HIDEGRLGRDDVELAGRQITELVATFGVGRCAARFTDLRAGYSNQRLAQRCAVRRVNHASANHRRAGGWFCISWWYPVSNGWGGLRDHHRWQKEGRNHQR